MIVEKPVGNIDKPYLKVSIFENSVELSANSLILSSSFNGPQNLEETLFSQLLPDRHFYGSHKIIR